jgi:hypothetical protein
MALNCDEHLCELERNFKQTRGRFEATEKVVDMGTGPQRVLSSEELKATKDLINNSV